jgi:hypothetical protein
VRGECDFCGLPIKAGCTAYKPQNRIIVQFPGVPWMDRGEWVACEVCAHPIDARQWKSLMARVCAVNPVLRGVAASGHIEELTRLLALTWAGVFGQAPEAFLE